MIISTLLTLLFVDFLKNYVSEVFDYTTFLYAILTISSVGVTNSNSPQSISHQIEPLAIQLKFLKFNSIKNLFSM